MMTKLFALVSAFAVALALAVPTTAQSRHSSGEWSAVQSLTPGTKIVVRTKDGDRLSGHFESADDQGLNFTRGGKRVTLTRDSVQRVQLSRGTSHLKGALIGLAIGAGAGAATGGIIVSKGDFNNTIMVGGLTALGAGFGTGIGAALGMGNTNETIYEAP